MFGLAAGVPGSFAWFAFVCSPWDRAAATPACAAAAAVPRRNLRRLTVILDSNGNSPPSKVELQAQLNLTRIIWMVARGTDRRKCDKRARLKAVSSCAHRS